jgi:hypothetical protein
MRSNAGIAEGLPQLRRIQAEFESLKHRPREVGGHMFYRTRVAPAADVSSAAPPLKSSSLQDAGTVDSSEKLGLFRLDTRSQKP